MEKITIDDLAPYLPHNLELWHREKLPFSEFLDTKKEAHSIKMGVIGMMSCINGSSKPLLRPLTDLIKEIDVNGVKIIPCDYWDEELKAIYYNKELTNYAMNNYCDFYLPYFIIEKLYKWHFDLNMLIEKKLAININTL